MVANSQLFVSSQNRQCDACPALTVQSNDGPASLLSPEVLLTRSILSPVTVYPHESHHVVEADRERRPQYLIKYWGPRCLLVFKACHHSLDLTCG